MESSLTAAYITDHFPLKRLSVVVIQVSCKIRRKIVVNKTNSNYSLAKGTESRHKPQSFRMETLLFMFLEEGDGVGVGGSLARRGSICPVRRKRT